MLKAFSSASSRDRAHRQAWSQASIKFAFGCALFIVLSYHAPHVFCAQTMVVRPVANPVVTTLVATGGSSSSSSNSIDPTQTVAPQNASNQNASAAATTTAAQTTQTPAQNTGATPATNAPLPPPGAATLTNEENGATTPAQTPAIERNNNLFTLAQPRAVPPLPVLERIGISSDQTLTLSLNDAIRRALENNNQIEVSRTTVRINETTLDSLRGVYQPVFAITPQITNQVQPLTQVFQAAGSGSAVTSITSTSFNLAPTISKQFARGGGRYDVFFNNSRSTGNLNNFNPAFNSSFGVDITQPLWRDRAIDSFRRDIRIQRKRLEQSDADFRQQVIEVIAQVQTAYWELVFALRDQQNRIANVNLARENFRITEARVAAGAAAPLARAEVQTELSTRETELLIAAQTVSTAENNLKALLFRDSQDANWSAQIVPTDEPKFDDTPVSLETAIAEAKANRPELRRLRVQNEINDIDQQFFRNQSRPRIDIVGNVSSLGFAGTQATRFNTLPNGTLVPIIGSNFATDADAFLLNQINVLRGRSGLETVTAPSIPITNPASPQQFNGGFGRSFRNLFNFDTRSITLGVRIEIPFRNQSAQANLAGARITREQIGAQTRLQEQVVLTEVRDAAQSVDTARRRILTARTAREAAELQLEGERRLFDAGRSTQFLLFQRENALTNARALELRAETDYNQALARLQRATSSTLRANNVTVDSPQ